MKRWRFIPIAVIILVCFGLVVTVGAKGTFTTLVETKYGKIQGDETEPGALAWKSIPYAKPPVGDLRWKAPEDPEKWDGVRDGTLPCTPCTQLITGRDWIRTGTAEGSEDCLYLSIYRPAHKKKNLPVYVWISTGDQTTLAEPNITTVRYWRSKATWSLW